ncbi:PepSY-associated TM helix domain-containing protein [Shewanella sp. A25]|nr:PepSY-associated TM helix domain-containing protein [Shewanella shenzhenensis]
MKIKVSKNSLNLARVIHVYVSMALLLLMLFFAFTGLTLNHPEWVSSSNLEPKREQQELPKYLLPIDADNPEWRVAVGHWLNSEWRVDINQAEFSEDEISVGNKGPGHYLNVTLDLLDATAYVESVDYGALALLNDLHKGRNSGSVWAWVLDLSAVLMILFSLTGAYLLLPQTKRLKKSLLYMVLVSSSSALVYVYFVP